MIKDGKGDTAGEIEAPRPHPKIAKEIKRANENTETEAKVAKENEAIQGTKSVIMYLSQTENTAKNRVKENRGRRNPRGVLPILDDSCMKIINITIY